MTSLIPLPSKTVDALILLQTHTHTHTRTHRATNTHTHTHPLCDLWLGCLIYSSLRKWSQTVSLTHLPAKNRSRRKVFYALRQPWPHRRSWRAVYLQDTLDLQRRDTDVMWHIWLVQLAPADCRQMPGLTLLDSDKRTFVELHAW